MPPKKTIAKLPINAEITYTKIKKEERRILEFDPTRIKAGEAVIVKVSKWGGLSNQSFVVLNIKGKELLIRQLTKIKPAKK